MNSSQLIVRLQLHCCDLVFHMLDEIRNVRLLCSRLTETPNQVKVAVNTR